MDFVWKCTAVARWLQGDIDPDPKDGSEGFGFEGIGEFYGVAPGAFTRGELVVDLVVGKYPVRVRT